MKPGITLLAPALALAGCATAQHGNTERFRCERGTLLTIVFLPDHAMLQAGNEAPVRLEQQRTGSGYAYMNPMHSIRGKGQALTYTMGRMAPEECTNIEH